MKSALRLAMVALSPLLAFPLAANGEDLRNWFNDPFFQISNGIANCPVPKGPLMTEAEKIAESHGRIERGTNCWLAGQCELPNAYLYDDALAERVRESLNGQAQFSNDSLWIMVSRKFVWVQGCVADGKTRQALDGRLKSVPGVDRVLIDVMQGAGGKPPYQTLGR